MYFEYMLIYRYRYRYKIDNFNNRRIRFKIEVLKVFFYLYDSINLVID